ncbi:MAG: hypothetical protein NVSMB57_01810 [Actinomycetota bacterium]
MRHTISRFGSAALAVAMLGALQLTSSNAATPSSLSINAKHRTATWSGGPISGSAPARRNITCDPSDTKVPSCDEVTLNVAAPKPTRAGVWALTITVTPSADNAMEINVCRPGKCAGPTSTDIDNWTNSDKLANATYAPHGGAVAAQYRVPESGAWRIRASCVKCVNATYSAVASLSILKPLKHAKKPPFSTRVLPGLDAKKAAGGGEPGVRIGRHGEVWIDAPGDSGDFWGSYDGGKTFSLAQPAKGDAPNTASGPGDTWMTVDADGTLYADVLYLSLGGGNIVYRSMDHGATWTALPGASNFTPGKQAALANVNSDRQWLTADPQTPGTVYFTYHDLTDGSIWVYKTTNHGDTWTPTANLTGQELVNRHEIDSFAGNTTGPIIVSPDGSLYFTIGLANFVEGQTAPPTRQDFDLTKIYVVRSTDGGTNWTFSLAHDGTGKEFVDHGHTPIAVDRSGNVYLVYSARASQDGLPDPNRTGAPTPSGVKTTLYLVHSVDRGTTWSEPVKISTNDASNVFPAVSAGGKPGFLDVAWLASPASDFNDRNAQWTVQFMQTRNALSSKPKLSYSQVSPDVVHRHDICQAGTACLVTGGDRNLLDYIWMDVDARGVAHIVYPDDASGTLRTVYATQKTGFSTFGRAVK